MGWFLQRDVETSGRVLQPLPSSCCLLHGSQASAAPSCSLSLIHRLPCEVLENLPFADEEDLELVAWSDLSWSLLNLTLEPSSWHSASYVLSPKETSS